MARIIQPSFNKGEVTPALYGRVDVNAYAGGLAKARNMIIHSFGGASRRPGTRFIGPVSDHSYIPRIIEFQFNVSDEYVLEMGDSYIRFVRDDGYVLTGEQTVTGATNANPIVITTSGSHGYSNGDEVWFGSYSGGGGAGGTDVNGMTELNQNRYKIQNVTSTTFELLLQVDGSTPVDGTGFGVFTSGGTVNKIYEISTPWDSTEIWELNYVQNADTMIFVHPSHAVRELTRSDHDNWTLSTPTVGPAVTAPSSISHSTTGGGATTNYRLTSIDDDTGEESDETFYSATNTDADPPGNIDLSWTRGDNQHGGTATVTRIYRAENSQWNFAFETTDNSSIDDNIVAADVDPTQRFPLERDPISASGEYPSAVGFYQQRNVFGGANNTPDTSHFSQVGSGYNFNYSIPGRDNDAFQATLTSTQVNQIRHYVPLNDLIILTSGAEWRINSGADSGFHADTFRQYQQSQWGASYDQPIVVGNEVLYITEDLGNVRSISYNLEIDGYSGNNLNIQSRHLLDGYALADWAYQRVPDPRIYLIRNDGTALSLTYDREQEILAWSRFDTLGDYEAVTVIRGNGSFSEDSIYFIVKRNIGGTDYRFLEVMRDTWIDDVRDGFYVDSGLSLDNPIAISGATSANPVVITTSSSHGLENGDIVDIDDIMWTAEYDPTAGTVRQGTYLNESRYVVTNKTSTTFELYTEAGAAVDGSTFPTYKTGGQVRLTVTAVTGLEHLEGQTVICLCDGNIIKGKVVTNASVSFDKPFSRIHIGLPHEVEFETLPMEVGQGTIQGMKKKLSNLTLKLFKSREFFFGPNEDQLVEMKFRDQEVLGAPNRLFSGEHRQVIHGKWSDTGQIYARLSVPLPLTILAVAPEFEVEDD